ncbi:MAG: hypothetical protein KH355_13580 [Clostridiales bacterium]|nr:hypothetical protein [Clostridiales bacterium]
MKKKIWQMSEGKFDIKRPKVKISEEKIQLQLKEGAFIEGEFQIESINKEPIKGCVISTNSLMEIVSERDFIETQYGIRYYFNGKNTQAGDKETGSFVLITDGGEFEVPYEVIIEGNYLTTSIGELKDIRKFLELVEKNREEALELFASVEFEKVLLKGEDEQKLVYQALLESRSLAQAMEEFIVFLKEKEPVYLSLNETKVTILPEQDRYEIKVKQNREGYVGAIIQEQKGYLHIEKTVLHQEDFQNQEASIVFEVDKISRSIHDWNTELEVLCGSQIIKIQVSYDSGEKGRKKREELAKKRIWKKKAFELYENWFLYHTNMLSEERYKNNEKKIALSLQEEEEGRKVVLPEEHYVHLLNRLSEEATKDSLRKKEELIALYENGYHSPFLSYEMLKDMNEEPELLTELRGAELYALKWGCKYHFVSMRLLDRFMQLASHEKQFSRRVFELAKRFYEQQPLKEYLTILCSILIKGNRMEEKYHIYYKLGVQESLKLIGLCEAYIRSMDHREYGLIPRSILLYFVDAEPLPEEERAYLFANILYHDREYEGILYQFGEKMQSFIKEQMQKGKISQDLFYLYRRNFERMLISEELLTELPGILFKQKITCQHPLITGVMVYHQETKKASYYPLINHTAYLDLYTDRYKIILLDKLGRRYVSSIPYDLQDLFEDSRYMRLCYQYNKTQPMLLYRLGRHTLKYHQTDARAIQVIKNVLTLNDIDEKFYLNCLKLIIDYYYENYEGELLDEYLQKVDLSRYEREDRNQLLEYMITRRMYGPVLCSIEEYGYHGIMPKRILRLTSYLLKSTAVTKDEFLLEMCMYAFRNERYDEYSLEYIGKYLISSLKELIEVWNTSFENSVRIEALEENILAQSLFEENICEGLFPIFASFWERKSESLLGKAFLRYVSYDSFVKEYSFPIEFYRILKEAVLTERITDDFGKMALLYDLSEQSEVEEEMLPWIQKTISEFTMEGIVLPFFQTFATNLSVPYELKVRKCVCYHGERNSIYYMRCALRGEEGKYYEKAQKIEMKEVMPGIYTAYFVVFYKEEMEYSVWQKTEHSDRMVKTGTLHGEKEGKEKEESRFDLLNSFLMSVEAKEDDKAYELAKEYIYHTKLIDQEWSLL